MTTVDTHKVYAVEPTGILRNVPSITIAKELYGNSWADLVQDIDPGYFSFYDKGVDIYDLLPTGTLVKEPENNTVYYISDNKKQRFLDWQAFRNNYFRAKDVIIKNNLSNYSNGVNISEFRNDLLPYALSE